MNPTFTEDLLRVMERLGPIAVELGHDSVDAEHLFISLLHAEDGHVARLMSQLNCEVAPIRRAVVGSLPRSSSDVKSGANLPLTKRAEAALKNAYLEAMGGGTDADLVARLDGASGRDLRIGTRVLLLALLRDTNDPLTRLLEGQFGITHSRVRDCPPDSSASAG